MIDHRVGPGHETEGEGSGKSEDGKEEHLERRYTKASGSDEACDGAVLHPGIRDQDPEVADGDGQIPKGHDRTLH